MYYIPPSLVQVQPGKQDHGLTTPRGAELKPEHPRTAAPRGPLRVVAIDDHRAIREALADTLDSAEDLELCGLAASGADAFELIERTRPDVAVVDLNLGDAFGLELVETLRERFPNLHIVIFSMYDERTYGDRALQVGARGYVMKSASTQNVVDAIRAAATGQLYFRGRVVSERSPRLKGLPPNPKAPE